MASIASAPEGLGLNLEIRCHVAPWEKIIKFLLLSNPRYSGDKRYVATNVTFEEYKDGQALEPTFKVSHLQAQALLDELWRCGIRPSNGEGSVGQLAATEKHLADMRAIVANKLEVKL